MEELTFDGFPVSHLSADTVLRILRECRSLKKLTLVFENDTLFPTRINDAVKTKISKQIIMCGTHFIIFYPRNYLSNDIF